MIIDRVCDWAKGTVWGYYFDPRTGERRGHFRTHNIVTYTGADLMARMLANQGDYVPKYMGFIYGTNAAPGLVDPDSLPSSTRRVHPWSRIATDLAGVSAGKANVLISPFTTAPEVSLDGDAAYYANNACTMAANSGSRLEYGFSTSGATYAPPLQDDGVSDYMFQALLLARIMSGTQPTYYPFARVSLHDPPGLTYSVKPQNWELAVFWKITIF